MKEEDKSKCSPSAGILSFLRGNSYDRRQETKMLASF